MCQSSTQCMHNTRLYRYNFIQIQAYWVSLLAASLLINLIFTLKSKRTVQNCKLLLFDTCYESLTTIIPLMSYIKNLCLYLLLINSILIVHRHSFAVL